MDKMFKIKQQFSLVTGKNGKAIYDLSTGDIYELNGEYCEALDNYNILEDVFIINENNNYIFKELEEMGIGIISDKNDVLFRYEDIVSSMISNNLNVSNHLESAFIEVTNKCNLNCSFCEQNVVNRATSCKRFSKEGKRVNLDKIKEYIIDSYHVGVNNISIIGGEPLLETDYVYEIIKVANSLEMKINIFTNGTIFPSNSLLELFKETDIQLTVQFITDDKMLGDEITNYKNYWDIMKNNISELILHGVNIRGQIIIGSFNEKEIDRILNSVKDLEIEDISYNYITPTSKNDFSISDKRQLFNKKHNIKRVNKTLYHNMKTKQICFSNLIALSVEGDFIPCPSLRLKLGNIETTTLADILNSNEYQKLKFLCKDKIDHCKFCKLRYGCMDCRAIEYTATGKINGLINCEEVINERV